MTHITEMGQGLLVWQSPVSFVLGAFVTWLYYRWKARSMTDHKPGFKKAWLYGLAATVVFCGIGYNTTRTATNQEHLAAETQQFAKQTNDCLAQVIDVLQDRASYNAALDDLTNRRTQIWGDMVFGLNTIDATIDAPAVNAQTSSILNQFFAKNKAIDRERAELLAKRSVAKYPDCGHELPGQRK